MHARTEDDGDCTSKRWECRNLDRVFAPNNYLLMPEYDSHSFDIGALGGMMAFQSITELIQRVVYL